MVERHWDLEPDKRRSGVAVPPPYMLFSVEGPMTDDRAWATVLLGLVAFGISVWGYFKW